MLEVDKVSYTFPEMRVDADFRIDSGQTLALMGPSGCGKSTILNLIAGFLVPDSGDIRFQGKSLSGLQPADRPLTILFQSHNLFPHLRVWQNLGLGINPGLRLGNKDRERIDSVLAEVGLEGFQERLPDQLSGGQQQRVALARSLLRNQPLLLLDEPFSALDQELRQEMVELILALRQERDYTLLLATHQKEDADALGAGVYRMDISATDRET